MMRFARAVTCAVVIVMAGADRSQAQTTSEPRWYGEIAAAATLGHKSDKAIAVEVGGRLAGTLDVFVEGGHMGNVGTADLEARAQKIANFIGGTVGSTADKVNFIDVGVRYRVPMTGMWHPYVAFGVGVAKVKPEVTFGVGGADVTGRLEDFGVQLGSDLTDSLNKTFIMAGFGTTVRFASRYFADISYRYGHILAKTSVIENDVAIKTQRVQAGIGIRF
jgi:opacity protein-like surface antigen